MMPSFTSPIQGDATAAQFRLLNDRQRLALYIKLWRKLFDISRLCYCREERYCICRIVRYIAPRADQLPITPDVRRMGRDELIKQLSMKMNKAGYDVLYPPKFDMRQNRRLMRYLLSIYLQLPQTAFRCDELGEAYDRCIESQ